MLRSERSDALLDAEFGEALLLEVVAEHVAQLGRGGVIAILVRPGVARIEDLAVDARAGFRHFQLEDRLRLGLDAIELAVQCGIEQRARHRQFHALTGTVAAAAPAGVEQDAARVMFLHLFGEQLGIDVRPMSHERAAEAGRERGLRFGRSEEHTSELQSLMRISYAVFCLKKKNTT